jgi:hypothetical protein
VGQIPASVHPFLERSAHIEIFLDIQKLQIGQPASTTSLVQANSQPQTVLKLVKS